MPKKITNWRKSILLNPITEFFLAFSIIVVLPSVMRWAIEGGTFFSDYQTNTLLANGVAFSLSFLFLHKLKSMPNTRSLAYIIPTLSVAWLAVLAVFLFLREASYARQVLLYSFLLANAWGFFSYSVLQGLKKPFYAIVPFGRTAELIDIAPHASIHTLTKPTIEQQHFDGIVADLHSSDLPAEWQRFLANCTLAGTPVYHVQQVFESMTGRVKVERLSENQFGSLQPSSFYFVFKRWIDCIAVFALAPLLLPIMLVTAIAIKIDSKGSVFYTQQRMGYRGRIFTMYKFRSMRNDIEGKGFTEGGDDPRITRVGAFIRKYRIDELPQVLNILKGEMSFIGPRPESYELSQWYEKDVPFFSYRHIVRPGISGWAQVNQGYAAEVEGMVIKIQYDFFYIKHFSLWLDLIIVTKTLRTVLTGFGAR